MSIDHSSDNPASVEDTIGRHLDMRWRFPRIGVPPIIIHGKFSDVPLWTIHFGVAPFEETSRNWVFKVTHHVQQPSLPGIARSIGGTVTCETFLRRLKSPNIFSKSGWKSNKYARYFMVGPNVWPTDFRYMGQQPETLYVEACLISPGVVDLVSSCCGWTRGKNRDSMDKIFL